MAHKFDKVAIETIKKLEILPDKQYIIFLPREAFAKEEQPYLAQLRNFQNALVQNDFKNILLVALPNVELIKVVEQEKKNKKKI